jgi:hypothetical protein
MARARGLGEVLHFFIPEDEQRGARERAGLRVAAPAGARWCLLATPQRPTLCALAIDLAAVLASSGRGVTLLAPFARGPVLPRAADVHWETCDDLDGELTSLLRRLESRADRSELLLLLPPARLRALLDHPAARTLDGLLLPVDASARGIARALGWLVSGGSGVERLRIGALVIGASGAAEAEAVGEQLARAARRQLGLEVALLGHLDRDPASYRSLLLGRSVVELESASRASSSLRALSERLVRWRDSAARGN